MTQASPSLRKVAVIGGGVSGLAAAHRLVELEPGTSVTLFEAGSRLGGVLRTEHEHGYLIEYGADNFITQVPWALDLCRRLGLESELLPTNPNNRRPLVVRKGRLYPIPEGFMLMSPSRMWPILTTPLLSWGGKLRLLREWFVPARQDTGDESLADFATRRLGREAFERLVQPLIAGIYTADSRKLSLAATMPRFPEMERRHGSLIRAALCEKSSDPATKSDGSGARYSQFVAPRDGMASLVTSLVARLPQGAVQLNTPVERVAPQAGGGWVVSVATGQGVSENRPFDAVIIATSAPVAAQLLATLPGELSRELAQIEYAGSAIVVVGYRREQIRHPLDGFGIVVPEVEQRPIIAVSFSSQKYPGRAPDDRVLMRVFMGGAMRPELLAASEDELQRLATGQLAELLRIDGEPEFCRVARWSNVMPQYHLGHLERVARIESLTAALPGLQLGGNAYHGVGVPHSIHSGEQAAERVLGHG